MLYYTRTGNTVVVPDEICPHADLALAHHQMQLHRACRIDLCAWKWVAYTTLIHHGHVVPPDTSPHDRALRRGLPDPTSTNLSDLAGPSNPNPHDPAISPARLDPHPNDHDPTGGTGPRPHETASRPESPGEADPTGPNIPEPQPFRQILDGLDRLTRDLREHGDGRCTP